MQEATSHKQNHNHVISKLLSEICGSRKNAYLEYKSNKLN